MYAVTKTNHDESVEFATNVVFDTEEEAWAHVDTWSKTYLPRLAVVNLSEPLVRRHDHPREGCDRCFCGCKYWEDDRCIDCGDRWSGVSA